MEQMEKRLCNTIELIDQPNESGDRWSKMNERLLMYQTQLHASRAMVG